MRTAVIAGFCALWASGSIAGDVIEWVDGPAAKQRPILVDQISRCWNIPAGAATAKELAVELVVVTDDQGGVTKVGILNPKNEGVSGDAEQSAARAALQCAPYSDVPAGEHRVKLNAADMF